MKSMSIDKTEISPAHVEANVKARKAVREIIDDCVPCLIAGVAEDRFWELLATEAAAHLGMVLVPDTLAARNAGMSDEDAMKFEKVKVPWGAHAGREVREVEPRYWLAITEGEFQRRLAAYLRSRRFQERQEA
jgi:hypothetical protein